MYNLLTTPWTPWPPLASSNPLWPPLEVFILSGKLLFSCHTLLAPSGPVWPHLTTIELLCHYSSTVLLTYMPPSGPLWPLLAPYAPIPDWSRKSIQQSIPSTRGPLWHASARLVTSTSLSAPGSLGTKDPCPLERASLNFLLFLGILLFIIIFNGALLRPAIQRLSFLYLEYVDNLSMWLLSIGIDVLYLPHQKKPCPSLKNRGQYTD